MTFELLIEQIENGKTFSQICNEQDYTLVERYENIAYYDDDLDGFLERIGARIEDFGVGYAIINTVDGKVYEVPYEEIENRFDIDLGNEIIIYFEPNRIYDVTDSYICD